ncbi:bacillithiol system redox-active protein YtxJ [Bacillus sp. 2205SS5-2]|uniref:bacillithiol system redox-active protein YtxJ n=1 Tax=Bacillus sp. 2205SS5-2 TaxID=3109031 RepID=UPI003004E05D
MKGCVGVKKVHTIEEFEEILKNESRFFFMKHSLTCPISGSAFNQYQSFATNSDDQTYFLAVQDSRKLSNYIAEKFGVRHESPQALLFVGGKPVWDASHYSITTETLSSR